MSSRGWAAGLYSASVPRGMAEAEFPAPRPRPWSAGHFDTVGVLVPEELPVHEPTTNCAVIREEVS
jgi:hypothetical protein